MRRILARAGERDEAIKALSDLRDGSRRTIRSCKALLDDAQGRQAAGAARRDGGGRRGGGALRPRLGDRHRRRHRSCRPPICSSPPISTPTLYPAPSWRSATSCQARQRCDEAIVVYERDPGAVGAPPQRRHPERHLPRRARPPDEGGEPRQARGRRQPGRSRSGDGARQHLSGPRAVRRCRRRLQPRHRARSPIPRRPTGASSISAASRYERSKQWPQAEADFKQALTIKPDQPQVLNYLGYSWVDMGLNLDQALGMIKTAVDLRPNDGYIVDSLGWAYYRLGRYDDAVDQLERAVELQAGRFGHQRPSRRRLLAGRAQARGDVPVEPCARPQSGARCARQDRQEAARRHDCRCRPRRLIRAAKASHHDVGRRQRAGSRQDQSGAPRARPEAPTAIT